MFKRKTLKEVTWLAAILIASLVLFWFKSRGNALDINMHDTYIADGGFGRTLSPMHFISTYFITLGFCVYFTRAVFFGFKAILTDIILLIFVGLFLYFSGEMIFIFYPPVIYRMTLPTEPVKGLFYGGSYTSTAIWLPHIVRIFLTVILSYTSFKIGRNWGSGPKK